MDILIAPDVFVNASVALGTPPEQVVNRVLGHHRGECPTTEWVLDRVRAMLLSVESFKKEAVDHQVETIRSLVKMVSDVEAHPPDAWERALVTGAKAGGATRVVTDHPDLLAKETSDGIEFISTEAWLLEQQLSVPPPPPPAATKK